MTRRRTSRSIIIASAVLVAAAALHASGVLAPVTDPVVGAVLRMAAPLHAAGDRVRRSGEALAAGADERIADLEASIDALRIENAKLRNTLEEHEELKAALKFTDRETDLTVLARVVSESADGSFRGIVLDRGADDGLRVGQPVLTGDGVIVGKIYAVRGGVASVQLLSDSSSKLAVALRNGADTLGVLEGDRGSSMAIALIPQSEVIAPGDIVVTSGAEPGIRRGYPVGTVEKVQRSTQNPFQTATVIPFASADRPVFVQVVIPDISI